MLSISRNDLGSDRVVNTAKRNNNELRMKEITRPHTNIQDFQPLVPLGLAIKNTAPSGCLSTARNLETDISDARISGDVFMC